MNKKRMLVAARRISGFLLLFVLVTATLSIEYLLLQGKDRCAAEKCNVLVSKRKTLQIRGENKMGGRKVVSGDNLMKMESAIKPRKSRYEAAARFVAYDADYRGPRRHPPKNN